MAAKARIGRYLLITGYLLICMQISHGIGFAQDSDPLIRDLSACIDIKGILTVEQAAELSNGGFSPVRQHFIPGFVDGALWFSFNLVSAGNSPVFIDFGPEIFDRADAYVYTQDEGWKLADSTGRLTNNNERRVVSWRNAIELVPSQPTVPVLIRVINNDDLHISLRSYTVNDFFEQTTVYTIFHAITLGIAFIIIVYLLLSFIWFREKLFLLLAISSGIFFCYQSVMKGFAHAYFGSIMGESFFFTRIGYILCCAGFTLTIITYIKYLDLIPNPKIYGIVLLLLVAGCGSFILLFSTVRNIKILYVISLCTLIILSVFICIPTIYLLTVKKMQTATLLIAWLPMLLYAIFRQTYHILRLNFQFPFIETLLSNDYYFSYDFCFLFHVVVYTWVIRIRIREQKKRDDEHKTRDYFFTTTAHELIAPVTLINHAVEGLEKSGLLKDGAANFTETIKGNCRRILKVTTLFTSLEEQNNPLDESKSKATLVSPVAMLQNILHNFEYYAQAHGNTIQYVSGIKSELKVFVDALFLEVVFINLLDNACKYSFENTIISLQLEYDSDLQELTYTVHNYGIPISAEEKKRLFDYNYRSESAKQLSTRGSGFGLHMVSRIAVMYGGSVSIQDGYGCIIDGNTFTVRLHLKSDSTNRMPDEESSKTLQAPREVSAVASSEPSAVKAAENADAAQPVILIMEDDLELLQSMEKLFLPTCQVVTAVNGQEAFDKICRHLPHMVLCDIVMPIMSGIDVYKKCQQSEELRTIPFLFISALSQNEAGQQVFSDGVLDYIQKPFDFAALQLKVASLLAYGMNIRQQYAQRISRLVTEAAMLPSAAADQPSVYQVQESKRLARYAASKLTKRECEVCEQLYEGKAYKSIAESLNTSVNTISTHCKNIYRKTGTQTKSDLIRMLSE